MSRKSPFLGMAAIAVGAIAIAGGTEVYGANAAQAEATPIVEAAPEAPVVDETVPLTFVSEEVVQELPEASEEAPVEAGQTQFNAASLRDLLSQVDAPADLSRQMECLAGAVYFESRGEPINGQLAVAQVVINRAESDVFPADYCGVVYQAKQFSFVKNGRMPRISRSSVAWINAKKIAKIAHEGLWDSEAQDSLYFHATYVKPKWSYRKKRRAAISTHVFYR